MPRRSAPLSRFQVVLASAIVCGCSGAATSDPSNSVHGAWTHGIPRGVPTVVTIENLSYDPPRVLGLVSEDHPAAKTQEAAIRRSGIKRIPADRMRRLIDVLEDEGFLDSAAPLAEFKSVDPKLVLRRLTVSAGDERRAFTLPRGPSKEAAERFNKQAIAVQAMFNEVVDFRQEIGTRDPAYFYEVARALFEPGTAIRRDAAKDGATPPDGKR